MSGLLPFGAYRYLDAPFEAPTMSPTRLPRVPGACPGALRGQPLTAPLELVVQARTWRRWQAGRRA